MGEPSRETTLFNLRYATRVLERHCRFWRRADRGLRFMAVMAGTGAIASMSASSQALAMAAGFVFAMLQALEIALRPSEVAATSMQQRKAYAALRAREGELDDVALARAYAVLVAEDEVVVPEVIRRLAYNDVTLECTPVTEHGNLALALYPDCRWDRFVSYLA